MKFRSVSPDFQEEIREKGSSLCLTRKPSCAIGTVPARPLRIEYPDAWYHVMNRGRRGENVFADEKDYNEFLALLQEASKMFGPNNC